MCIPSLVSAAAVGFWELRNGCSPFSCCWDSGTKKLGILGALGSVAIFLRAQLDNKCYISRAAG